MLAPPREGQLPCNDSCSVLQYASLIDCASSMLASLCEHLMLHTEYHRGSIPLEMALQLLSYHAAGIVLGLI